MWISFLVKEPQTMRDTAHDYPGLFAAIAFGAAAFGSAILVAFFYILLLRSDGLIADGSGTPFDVYLFLYILLLPALLTGVIAALLGRRLIADGELTPFQAARIGGSIAALGFLLWAAAGELLWVLIDFPAPNPADSGVVDFLALLGYVLMGVVFLVVVGLGAVVGVGLRSWRQGQYSRDSTRQESYPRLP
jgi:hypothetical protein